MRNYASYPTWEHMEIKECHHAYDQMFVAEHHDLILVTSDSEPPSIFRPSLINDIADQGASYGLNGTDSSDGPFTGTRKWAEGKLSCSPIAKPSDCAVFDGLTAEEREDCRSITERSRMYEKCRWSISNRNIKYCLSEPIAAKCTLNFHIPVMIYVVVANALKLLCMISTILNTGEDPLVTIGDSISSFLVHPDPYTQGKCTASVFTFHERESQGKPKEWDTSRYRWWKAVPGLLYIFFIILYVLSLVLSLTIFLCIYRLNTNLSPCLQHYRISCLLICPPRPSDKMGCPNINQQRKSPSKNLGDGFRVRQPRQYGEPRKLRPPILRVRANYPRQSSANSFILNLPLPQQYPNANAPFLRVGAFRHHT